MKKFTKVNEDSQNIELKSDTLNTLNDTLMSKLNEAISDSKKDKNWESLEKLSNFNSSILEMIKGNLASSEIENVSKNNKI